MLRIEYEGVFQMMAIISAIQLDNRELAFLTILILIIVYIIRSSNWQTILKALAGVLKAAANRTLVVLYLLLAGMSYLVISGMSCIPLGTTGLTLWSNNMLESTITEIVFVGFPGLYIACNCCSDKDLFGRFIAPCFGASALIEFYLGLEIQPYLIELILQAVFILLLLTAIYTARNQKDEKVHLICTKSVSCIVIIYLFLTTISLIIGFGDVDWAGQLQKFLFMFWYPLAILLLLYPLAHYAAFETLNIRMKRIDRIPLKERALVGIGLFNSVRLMKNFSGSWTCQLTGVTDASDVRKILDEYRKELQSRMREAMSKAAFTKYGRGKTEFNSNGIWLDREMSKEVKHQLLMLAYYLRIQYQKFGQYKVLSDTLLMAYIPKGCTCQSKVSNDQQMWLGLMRTPSGLVYGIGATNGSSNFKYWEGTCDPEVTTSISLRRFVSGREECPNWNYDDDIQWELVR